MGSPFQRLQARIDWLALQGQDAEDALMDSPQWFMTHKAFQAFDAQRELPQGERALTRQAA